MNSEVVLLYSGVATGQRPAYTLHRREDAHLTAAKDRNGRFSGYYKCSHCNAEFRPNPNNHMEMSIGFLLATFGYPILPIKPPLEK